MRSGCLPLVSLWCGPSRTSLGLAVLGLSACRAPTQITFDITTNVACSELDDTSFTSGPLAGLTDGRPAAAVTHRCASAGRIGSVVVVPSASDKALVAVKIVTGVGVSPDRCGPSTKCIVAKRALNFIPNAPLVVHVDMSSQCEGVVCDGDQTCEKGQCVSAVIGDPSKCEGTGCGGDVLTPGDGGASDAGSSGSDATASSDASIDATLPVDSGVTPAAVGVGYWASCALLRDGTVQCWGTNTAGSLGDDAASDIAYFPQPVPGLARVTSLAVGTGHTCVVVEGGGVECWGYRGTGAVGTGAGPDELVPVPIVSLQYQDGGSMRTLTAGENHTCGVAVDGVTLWCWGAYDFLQATAGSTVPVYLATLDAGVAELAAGKGVTCARALDGTVWCWGQNTQGVLGQANAVPLGASILTPLPVPIGAPAAQLAVGAIHACVVTTSHDLLCWGDDSVSQLGSITIDDGGTYVASPTSIPLGAGSGHVVKVGCGDNHTCALFDDGGVQCWGYNFDGELGVVSQNQQSYPVSVPNLGAATDLFVHGESACAKLVGGGVACWGNDAFAQLGAGPIAADAGQPIGAFPVHFR